MGVRGPVPKRSDARLGHRSKAETPEQVDRGTLDEVKSPSADPRWHPYARSWFNSLGESGQSVFYEPSDWTFAMLLAKTISDELYPKFVGMAQPGGKPVYAEAPMSGQSLQAVLKGMSALLVTEGDRRRAQMELSRRKADEEEDAQILHLVRDEEEQAFG